MAVSIRQECIQPGVNRGWAGNSRIGQATHYAECTRDSRFRLRIVRRIRRFRHPVQPAFPAMDRLRGSVQVPRILAG